MKITKNCNFLFFLFWIIALLPKSIQLLVLAAGAFWLNRYKIRIKIDYFTAIQYVVLTMYFVSIIFNIVAGKHEMNRIFATANTFLITFVSLQYYTYFSNNKVDYSRISKYIVANCIMLFLLLAVYLFYPKMTDLKILGNDLYAIDYYEKYSTRFIGFFSYANLIPLFALISIPAICDTFKNKKIISFIFLALLICATYFANSRSGLVILLVIAGVYIYTTAKEKCNKYILRIITIILLVLILIIFKSLIFDKIESLYMGRAQSNSMRFYIYKESIDMMLNKNPILGMGIKDLINGTIYPYGSHSSYIGYFYKTGIIGGVLYTLSYVLCAVSIIKRNNKSINDLVTNACLIGIFIWMIFEDLDGENWAICYTMMIIGTLNNEPVRNMKLINRGTI